MPAPISILHRWPRRPRARTSFVAAVAVLCTAFALRQPEPTPADRAAWHADLEKLTAHLAIAYANFEWSVRENGFDAAARLRDARAAIDQAGSESDARKAAEALLAAFRDGHTRVSRLPRESATTSATPSAAALVPVGASASQACRALGYTNRDRDFEEVLTQLPNYTPRTRGVLRTATARTADGVPVALVRLHHTAEDGWRGVCERLWERVAPPNGAACDRTCGERVRHAVGDSLLAFLASELRAMRDGGARVLLLDLTRNGGGSEWADAVVQTLAPAGTPDPVMGMVRHPHWIRALTRDSTQLALLVAQQGTVPALQAAARERLALTTTQLAELRQPCDWRGVWQGSAPPDCSPLVPRMTTPVPLDSVRRWGPDASTLRPVVAYRFEANAWRAPIVVVTDRGTASAAEEIGAMLADHAGAVLAGERSMGIGCGFTNGGITLDLEALGLRVRMPDCARLRADGRNERRGLVPDAAVAWQRGDDTDARRAKVERAVGVALATSSHR